MHDAMRSDNVISTSINAAPYNDLGLSRDGLH
jgi:hypothetical protein